MAAAVEAFSSSDRKYHNTTSAYVLPNDSVEQNRLDAQAAAIVEMIGGFPCLAPIHSMTNVSKVVDVGCGTGVATVQLASIFPSAKVYGLDISEVPDSAQKMAPKNVTWAVGNVLDIEYDKRENDSQKPRNDSVMSHEIFTPGELDYIFGRMLFLGISDWARYFSTTARSLRSGGIIEHQDLDWKFYRVGTSECLSDKWDWHKHVVSAAEKSGLSTHAGSGAAPLMKKAGLEIVSVQEFEFSFVPSSKTPNSQSMGRYVQAKLIPQYPELLRKMLGAEGITGDELRTLTETALRDLASEEGVHQKYTVTIGRKS
ncbi:uncharacterized protein KY384_000297 [Bacidia gigantensis]|uniref:uncharacterized protein n=1 Tax=Bacidia gigantensis TaxID=2732470 RepID=UPI001D0568CF|nr:uncharacterized protein KY384_000297 [Bacidia gigantensis]KAG8526304.1 hypothetical protein KY384_000297 [Bacidia gigantensis]